MFKYCCVVKCIYVGHGVNVQQFRDGVHGKDVCFPLFHCFTLQIQRFKTFFVYSDNMSYCRTQAVETSKIDEDEA